MKSLFIKKILILPLLGLCRPGAVPSPTPFNPPSYTPGSNRSNLNDESYKSPVSRFEQVFFAPPALIVLHNAAVTQLRYKFVLLVTLAFTSDLEADNCTHECALTLTRVGGLALSFVV
jgi:hypothetical protein